MLRCRMNYWYCQNNSMPRIRTRSGDCRIGTVKSKYTCAVFLRASAGKLEDSGLQEKNYKFHPSPPYVRHTAQRKWQRNGLEPGIQSTWSDNIVDDPTFQLPQDPHNNLLPRAKVGIGETVGGSRSDTNLITVMPQVSEGRGGRDTKAAKSRATHIMGSVESVLSWTKIGPKDYKETR